MVQLQTSRRGDELCVKVRVHHVWNVDDLYYSNITDLLQLRNQARSGHRNRLGTYKDRGRLEIIIHRDLSKHFEPAGEWNTLVYDGQRFLRETQCTDQGDDTEL